MRAAGPTSGTRRPRRSGRSATSSRAGTATRSRAPSASSQQSQTSLDDGVYPRLLALISLSLAIFNLLPFLPLDGGHILFALIEFFRKRPLAREVYERVSLIGIVAMLMLFAIGLSNDVGHITNGPPIAP